MGSGCSSVVEYIPLNRKIVGSNLAMCCAFFLRFLSSQYGSASLKQVPHRGATLLIFIENQIPSFTAWGKSGLKYAGLIKKSSIRKTQVRIPPVACLFLILVSLKITLALNGIFLEQIALLFSTYCKFYSDQKACLVIYHVIKCKTLLYSIIQSS